MKPPRSQQKTTSQHPTAEPSIRAEYESAGVKGFYIAGGDSYRNPHEWAIVQLLEKIIPDWQPDLSAVLDLAAGSGEATLALRSLGAGKIVGVDPYTFAAYEARTGTPALRWSFAEVADEVLGEMRFGLIVCSFALHLCEPSRLPGVCLALARISPALLVLTPHKRPEIRTEWGWQLKCQTVHRRVRARLYESSLA